MFTSDQRLSIKKVNSQTDEEVEWRLVIVNTNKQDQGLYECQVNTEPKTRSRVFLTITGEVNNVKKRSRYDHRPWQCTLYTQTRVYEITKPYTGIKLEFFPFIVAGHWSLTRHKTMKLCI